LFPVFAKAREKARQASCQSNLKQMGLAMAMYVQDFDESFPWRAHTWSYYWNRDCYICPAPLIQPYVKNWQLFECPAVPGIGMNGHGTYAFECDLIHDFNSAPTKLAQIQAPAECPMFFDAGCHWASLRCAPTAGNYQTRLAVPSKRHNDGSNICYVDGHVKWMKSDERLRPGRWNVTWR